MESVIVDRLTEDLLRKLAWMLRPALPFGQQYVVGTLPCGGPMVLRLQLSNRLMIPLEKN